MGLPTQRLVARATRPGGPEVIEVRSENIPPLKPDEILVRVEVASLNHGDSLIRSGRYLVRVPFPCGMGLEGAGVVEAAGPDTDLPPGTRVCWAGVPGSCATYAVMRAAVAVPVPDGFSLEEAGRLAHAGVMAGGLSRVWPLNGSAAMVWGAAGAVGRVLVARLVMMGVAVIGVASGDRTNYARSLGAVLAVDRTADDVANVVLSHPAGASVAAVFDPIGAATFETSLKVLAPRGCLVTYGQLSGPVVDTAWTDQLFRAGGVFVTKFNGRAYVSGNADMRRLAAEAIDLARRFPLVLSGVAGRYRLRDTGAAYAAFEQRVSGKILVLPSL